MWYTLLKPLLFRLEPEVAHKLSFSVLKRLYCATLRKRYLATLPQKPVTINGMHFANPVGLAAGLDKNGDYMDVLAGLGFGFIELGTVTPRPQSGNLKPRLFRIPQANALINRMGFNNLGVDYLVERLKKRPKSLIVGANVGKNKDTPLDDAANDYCYGLSKVFPYVDYVTINISSPNTPGLRKLQSDEYLTGLLSAITQTRQKLSDQHQRKLPLWLKIAPDLTGDELSVIVELLLKYQIDAVVATNTTIDHDSVNQYPHADEQGGLSGAPLFDRSTQVVSELNQHLKGEIPIVAVGGILTAKDTLAKLNAGASLVQLYTGLIYSGPGLIKDILRAIPD